MDEKKLDQNKLDELMEKVSAAGGGDRVVSNQEMAEIILKESSKEDGANVPDNEELADAVLSVTKDEDLKPSEIPTNEDIAEEILGSTHGLEVNEIPPDMSISDVISEEEKKADDPVKENESGGFFGFLSAKLKTDRRAAKIILAAAVLVIALAVALAVTAASLSSRISDRDEVIAKKNVKIAKQAELISKKDQKAEKWKKKAIKYRNYILKKKRAAENQVNKARKQAISNAQKIAVYDKGSRGVLTKSAGAVYYMGHKETYYSSRVLYHRETGNWHTDSNGIYHDQDGYICVASNTSDLSRGQLVMTSRGIARVHDSGCAKGTIDLYVNW